MILRVAIFPPGPAGLLLDYLPPSGMDEVLPGSRIKVTLKKQSRIGVVMETASEASIEKHKLRRADVLIDEQPLFPADLSRLFHWMAAYYQCPIGPVLLNAVPKLARQGAALLEERITLWQACGDDDAPTSLARARVQKKLFAFLREHGPLEVEALNKRFPGWRPAARALVAKGLAATYEREPATVPGEPFFHELSSEQSQVLRAIASSRRFERHLIEGVTGSGKTEIYLRAIDSVLHDGGQALVLVPEIGLTSQTLVHFRRHYGRLVTVFHSGMSDRDRFCSWSRAYTGTAKIIVGTRSAVFVPCRSLAMIIVDEEHDVAYKHKESVLRYHARDLAIKRAQLLDIPVVLGSATPSLESLHNVETGQYRCHFLSRRVGNAAMPAFDIINLRRRPIVGGVCDVLLKEIVDCAARDEQALLFLNRRGYATQLVCHDCGKVVMCPHCDVSLVYHLGSNSMRCHHCGYVSSRASHCAGCGGGQIKDTGIGTEQIEQRLMEILPGIDITRMDSDSVSRKDELDRRLDEIHTAGARILIGTQMLSKGHHFPRVTLVGILNVDQRLFAPDFRSLERLGQLVMQVSGRAGRGDMPGKVCLQTYHPEDPYLQCLLRDGYTRFARLLLAERKRARMPPYYCMSLIRASANRPDAAKGFLSAVAARLKAEASRCRIIVIGPAPMMLEKRAGHYRAQLLLRASHRAMLGRFLNIALPEIHAGIRKFRGVTWHVDVDPVEVEN